MSFAPWSWTRNRTHQPRPTLGDTNPANTPPAGNANDGNGNVGAASAKDKDKKTHDSLFGPNIGVVGSGPAWTATSEKKVLTDELTSETVSGWIAKSKDASQPTTTLQALVNLKRPTIRLSPLTSEDDDAHHHHGLEFEYDCDAPKCGIYVHVLLPPNHPDATATVSGSGLSKHLVFESVVEGGFEKLLKLEEGALFELGRFEQVPTAEAAATPTPTVEASSTPDLSAPAADASNSNLATGRNRRRFTHLYFRRRSEGRSVSGPALAVVDAEPTPAPADAAPNAKGKEELGADEGVKVTIRLAALDEQGTELASPNEQVTYLHIVRLGARPEGQADTEEDTRPWVVKVVKREATIGAHTFQLHEIYGLVSSSSHAPAPTAVLDTHNHPYPPPAVSTVELTGAEDDPSSECLLCLSSPREVVLLPCRHLVACRDCALNMVEFGAGGTITQAEEPVPTPTAATPTATPAGEVQAPVDAAGNGAADAAAPAAAAAATPNTNTNATANTRRKRKAKGWFCPVCRQPYTSLLRITTSPPPAPAEESDPKETVEEATPAAEAESNTRGILGGGFLRGLNFGRAPPSDVESQAGTGRVGS